METTLSSNSSKRPYTGFADYTAQQGAPVEVFIRAAWREVIHKGRPALEYRTRTGKRWRYLDGQEPRHDSPFEYQGCWYGLKPALKLAASGQPLILVNGAPGVVVAQHYGLAAFAVSDGEARAIPADMLAELKATWQGDILIALDCDDRGQRSAATRARQLIDAGFIVKALDLKLHKNGDIADFCKLNQTDALAKLADLPEIAPEAPIEPRTINIDKDTRTKREEWCRDVVLPTAQAALEGRGVHSLCINPAHRESHASARIGKATRAAAPLGLMYYCTCGSHTLETVGEWLGLNFKEWVKEKYPRPTVGKPKIEGNSEFVPPNKLTQVDPFAHLPSAEPKKRIPGINTPTVEKVDTTPDYYESGSPHRFLTLLLNLDPDGALPFEFLMRLHRAKLLDCRQPFAKAELLKARVGLPEIHQPSYDTIQGWFDPDSPALATIVEFVPPSIDNSLGGTNSENVYRLRSIPAILTQLMHRARLEGLATCYPTDKTGAIVPFEESLLKAMGCKQSITLADAIESVRATVDHKIAEDQTRAARHLRKFVQRVRDYAADREVIAYSDEMPVQTTSDLRAMLARGIKEAGLLPKPTKADWMWELGLHTSKGVDGALKKAGINQQQDTKTLVLKTDKPGEQIRRYGKANRAKVLFLELLDQEGQVVGKRPYEKSDRKTHALVCDHAITGGMTRAIFQLPNESSLSELPSRPARQKPAVSTAGQEQPTAQTETQESKPEAKPEPKTRIYPGQVDPVWFREHQILLLYALDWVKKEHSQTVYVNPNTGQKLPKNASIAELLALVSGVPVEQIIGDNMRPEYKTRVGGELLDEAIMLGGVEVAYKGLSA